MSLATFVRAAVVLGSFAVIAPMGAGCSAQVGGDGQGGAESTSQAIANCKESDPTCSIFGSTPKGCALNPYATGCPDAKGYTPPTGCNSADQCCLSGGLTLAYFGTNNSADAQCAADLTSAKCGGWNSTTAKADASVTMDYVASDTSGHYWFQVFCPTGTSLPASCNTPSIMSNPPSAVAQCEGGEPNSVYFTIDPTSCSGGNCGRVVIVN